MYKLGETVRDLSFKGPKALRTWKKISRIRGLSRNRYVFGLLINRVIEFRGEQPQDTIEQLYTDRRLWKRAYLRLDGKRVSLYKLYKNRELWPRQTGIVTAPSDQKGTPAQAVYRSAGGAFWLIQEVELELTVEGRTLLDSYTAVERNRLSQDPVGHLGEDDYQTLVRNAKEQARQAGVNNPILVLAGGPMFYRLVGRTLFDGPPVLVEDEQTWTRLTQLWQCCQDEAPAQDAEVTAAWIADGGDPSVLDAIDQAAPVPVYVLDRDKFIVARPKLGQFGA